MLPARPGRGPGTAPHPGSPPVAESAPATAIRVERIDTEPMTESEHAETVQGLAVLIAEWGANRRDQ